MLLLGSLLHYPMRWLGGLVLLAGRLLGGFLIVGFLLVGGLRLAGELNVDWLIVVSCGVAGIAIRGLTELYIQVLLKTDPNWYGDS